MYVYGTGGEIITLSWWLRQWRHGDGVLWNKDEIRVSELTVLEDWFNSVLLMGLFVWKLYCSWMRYSVVVDDSCMQLMILVCNWYEY